MAKKDKSEEQIENKYLALEALLKKKYKVDVMLTADGVSDERDIIIPVSPRLDVLLNGGLQAGSWMNIIGKPKKGKTTTVLRMAKVAQDAGYFVIYNNVEHRLKDMNLKGCAGLDLSPNKFRRIQSTREKTLTNQDFLNMNEDILRNTEKVICIFDSISALASGKQMEEGAGTSSRGGMSNSVVVSQFCSNMAPVVLMNKHIIVNIQQTMANVSGYGPTSLAKGGEAIKFQADTILWIKTAKEVLSGGKIIGQTVEWEAECSALGTIPGTKVESMIRYGEGIDIYWELIEMAKEFGIINASGAWLNYGDVKAQGVENFNVLLRENKSLFDEIYGKVKETYEV